MKTLLDLLPVCLGADISQRLSRLVSVAILLVAAPAWANVTIDALVSQDVTVNSRTATSPAFSTASGNELLLAFIATDFISGTNTRVTSVTGAGLTWVLVVRTNVQQGTSEIWRAFSPVPLSNVTVTATMSQPVMSSITVVSFMGVDPSGTNGSGAIGAIASGNASFGSPNATLVTTRDGSLVVGVGNDFDNAIPRILGPGQMLLHEALTSVGDTYWVQAGTTPPASGTSVTLNAIAPTFDQYNLSICEILAAPPLARQTFNMSGTVSPAGDGAGTLVTLAGALLTTSADAAGNFSFSGLPNAIYMVTPFKAGYTFSPPTRFVTINGSDVADVDFTAQPMQTSWSVSGTVTPAADGSGTIMSLGDTAIAIVDGAGNYTFPNVLNGTMLAVTPQKAGYVFSPGSRVVTVNGANVTGINFTVASVSKPAETPDGLVAAYGFNEAADALQVTDASGHGNTGTISGATRTTTGKFGGALSFNGTSSWVTVPDATSLDLTTGMTIEAWVRPSSVTGWRTVVMKESPTGLAYALYASDDDSRAAGYVRLGQDVGIAGKAMDINIWTHLALTYDGSNLRMFVNGVEVDATGESGAAITTSGVLRIGGNSYWGEYFRGLIDEVRIYNRALTASEIQTDMNTPIP